MIGGRLATGLIVILGVAIQESDGFLILPPGGQMEAVKPYTLLMAAGHGGVSTPIS